jgi:RHH-type proline utilization regulon transcriptional repressor/proline dehydrogenase/delta 1-pyrroline-5-carboxylate dehydrogenase
MLRPVQGLEASIREIGKSLSDAYPPAIRHPSRSVDQRLMQMVADRPDVQAALFRFVDATPACRTPEELTEHLTALLEEVEDPPALFKAPEALGRGKVGEKLVGSVAAAGVRHLAQRFIVGESPKAAAGHLNRLWRDGAGSSLDLLGEATVTQEEADHYAARCADAIATLAAIVPAWPERPFLERDFAGPIPRANVSVKISALTPLIRPSAPELGAEDAGRRLIPLLRQARDTGTHLHIDMESVDTLETTMHLVLEMLAAPEFREGPSAGVVMQAYLRESPAIVTRVLEWMRSHPRAVPLTIRLVKGAYWDHEVAEARQRGWSPPVFTEKADSDRNFEALTRLLIDARPGIRLAVASHNLRSVSHAIAYNRLTGGSDSDIEIQVLQGLGDDLKDALATHRIRTRVYCPVGDLVMGMAYLVRRLLENTASTSFLSAHGRGVPIDELLAAP